MGFNLNNEQILPPARRGHPLPKRSMRMAGAEGPSRRRQGTHRHVPSASIATTPFRQKIQYERRIRTTNFWQRLLPADPSREAMPEIGKQEKPLPIVPECTRSRRGETGESFFFTYFRKKIPSLGRHVRSDIMVEKGDYATQPIATPKNERANNPRPAARRNVPPRWF